jgi:Na+/serine symporter
MSLEESHPSGQSSFFNKFFGGNLILRIAFGIVAGVILAYLWPEAAKSAMLLGNLFVQALKAVAPVLVLVLVASALANQKAGHHAQLRPIVILYLVGTLSAAFLAVTLSFMFPTTLTLVVTDVAMSQISLVSWCGVSQSVSQCVMQKTSLARCCRISRMPSR